MGTMQQGDKWFWPPISGSSTDDGLHSLQDLKAFYHYNVGANTNLLMDIAPNSSGLVPAAATARYKAFGDWRRTCYQSGYVAEATAVSVVQGGRVELQVAAGSQFDRMIL